MRSRSHCSQLRTLTPLSTSTRRPSRSPAGSWASADRAVPAWRVILRSAAARGQWPPSARIHAAHGIGQKVLDEQHARCAHVSQPRALQVGRGRRQALRQIGPVLGGELALIAPHQGQRLLADGRGAILEVPDRDARVIDHSLAVSQMRRHRSVSSNRPAHRPHRSRPAAPSSSF